jgi:hypothetical protein
MMLSDLFWLLLLAADLSTPPKPPTAAKAAPVQESALSIPAGGTTGKGLLRLPLGAEVNDEAAAAATLTDRGGFPKVAFANQGSSTIGSSRYLYFLANASDIPTISFLYPRKAVLRVSGKDQTVDYRVTNQATQLDKLRSVICATDWSALDEPLPLVVSTADLPATRLEVSGAFTEKSNRVALPKGAVVLCDTRDGQCGAIDIPAYSTRLYLRYGGPHDPGIYAGSITLSAVEYAGATPSALTVYVTPVFHLWGGVLAVGIGVFIAWWVKTWTGNRIARDQALLPVAAYQERLRSLTETLRMAATHLDTPCPNLMGALQEWTREMDAAWLETKYGLPGRSPSPFQRIGSISNDFMNFLTQADAAITLLSIFVVCGLKRVAELAVSGQIQTSVTPKTAANIVSV